MNSVHPDFAHLSADNLSNDDILRLMRDNPPNPVTALNGTMLDIDSERGWCRFKFEIAKIAERERGLKSREVF